MKPEIKNQACCKNNSCDISHHHNQRPACKQSTIHLPTSKTNVKKISIEILVQTPIKIRIPTLIQTPKTIPIKIKIQKKIPIQYQYSLVQMYKHQYKYSKGSARQQLRNPYLARAAGLIFTSKSKVESSRVESLT